MQVEDSDESVERADSKVSAAKIAPKRSKTKPFSSAQTCSMRKVLAMQSSEIGGKEDTGIRETTDSLISEVSDDKLTDDSVSAGSTSGHNNTPAASVKARL